MTSSCPPDGVSVSVGSISKMSHIDRVHGASSLERPRKRLPWGATIVVASLLVVTGTILISMIRQSILRAAGHAVVATDPLERVDLIVVMFDTDGGGALEAADLVRSGIGSRVAVFADPPDPIVDREFLRRGVPYEDMAARETRQLQAVGIDNVEKIPKPTSDAKEGPILASWCDQHQYHSVIIITNLTESRLVRRIFHRFLKSHHVRVLVCSAPYGDFDPDWWWRSHSGIRAEIGALENLMIDIVQHPLS
jgi:hypothetical protein